jgi:hypothetical protein
MKKQMDNEKAESQRERSSRSTKHIPSSCQSSALQLQRLLRNSCKVHLLMPVLWHVLAGSNAVDCHFGVEFEAAEKLRGDEKVLASTAAVFACGGAGDVHETGVD